MIQTESTIIIINAGNSNGKKWQPARNPKSGLSKVAKMRNAKNLSGQYAICVQSSNNIDDGYNPQSW